MSTKAPDGFRFDILAVEMTAALNEVVMNRGYPAVVWMRGLSDRDTAERLRFEIVKHTAEIDRRFNKDSRVVFKTKVVAGKTEAGGYDVQYTCERGTNTLIVPRG